MKKYCQCGAATEYTLEIPKFCAGCGQSYSAGFISQAKKEESISMRLPKKKTKAVVQLEDDDYEDDEDDEEDYDEEEENEEPIKLSKKSVKNLLASVEIAGNKYQPVGNIKNIMGTQTEEFIPRPVEKMSKKKALERVKSMATPKRSSSDIK